MYLSLTRALICSTGLAVASSASAAALSLDEFLKQVRTGNLAVQGSTETAEGAKLRSGEANLVYTPSLYADVQFANDQSQSVVPAFEGTERNRNSYNFGVQQQFSFGLRAKLGWNFFHQSTVGALPTIVLIPEFYDSRPTLEIIQPLWKNGFGSETKANFTITEASALATVYSERFRTKMSIAEAEAAYWRLALARESLDLSKENLTRASRMKSWSERRTQLSLSDRSDSLQADSSYRQRNLELRSAQDEERDAARAFNLARGLEGDEVKDILLQPTSELIDKLNLPKRGEKRDDLLAAEQQTRMIAAQAELGKERSKPTLDVFSSLSLSGRNGVRGDAISDSFTTKYPVFAIGLRFSTPLAFGDLADNKTGYAREQAAADLNLERKRFEQEREWNDLTKRLDQARERFKMALELEKIQQERISYERDKLGRGRSTFAQLTLFEGDYTISQLSRLRIEGEILNIIARLKTFAGDEQ